MSKSHRLSQVHHCNQVGFGWYIVDNSAILPVTRPGSTAIKQLAKLYPAHPLSWMYHFVLSNEF